MAFNVRKYKFRIQLRDASSKKPRRVSLVAQRRILSRGKFVTAGAKADLTNPKSLRQVIAKPKLKGIKTKGTARKSVSGNAKVGGKWRRTLQSG